MIKAVLFDAIDTLFGANPNKIKMYQRIIQEKLKFGVDTAEMQRAWDEAIAETEEEAKNEIKHHQNIGAWNNFNKKILEKLSFPGDLEEASSILLFESWSNPENFLLYDDVKETLIKLRENDIKIGCVSNELSSLKRFFEKFEINDLFDTIIISEEVECEKPNAKIFNLACEKLNIMPNEIIFVGDSVISDYEGSMKAGMHPILIDREEKCLNNSSIKCINNLFEIFIELERINQNASTTA